MGMAIIFMIHKGFNVLQVFCFSLIFFNILFMLFTLKNLLFKIYLIAININKMVVFFKDNIFKLENFKKMRIFIKGNNFVILDPIIVMTKNIFNKQKTSKKFIYVNDRSKKKVFKDNMTKDVFVFVFGDSTSPSNMKVRSYSMAGHFITTKRFGKYNKSNNMNFIKRYSSSNNNNNNYNNNNNNNNNNNYNNVAENLKKHQILETDYIVSLKDIVNYKSKTQSQNPYIGLLKGKENSKFDFGKLVIYPKPADYHKYENIAD
jgi:hypothetical protein